MAWKHIKKTECKHQQGVTGKVVSDKIKCALCDVEQDLRICLTCGHVGCCESSNAHNTDHFKQTSHPLIKPYRCDYDWLWCYSCEAFLD